MKPQSTLKLRASILALAAGFALSALPPAVQAAGLGKVTVFSALGQPLRAEVEFSATREELSSMKASLASPDAFKAAGLDYASALQTIRFSIDKRANGQPIVRLTSERPINDPFVDMLMELNWASGRLVREYTFLLDPPEMIVRAPAPVTTPAAKPAMAPAATPAAPAPASQPAVQSASVAEAGVAHEVKRGDTLRKVAAANQHDGVSLEQMLVGLYRANQDAFDGNNMNRLRAGKILSIPAKSEVEAISETEANKVVAVQAADWNAYRRKLAAAAAQAPTRDDAGKQEAAGRITAKVEEKQAPAAAAKDQVRVSKTEVGKAKPGARVGEEELLAKEKALKEANERLASLEKNVSELQKLLEMKNRSLAELQQQIGKSQAAAAAVQPVAAQPVEPATPAEAPKPEVKKAEVAAQPAVAAAPVVPAEPPKVEAKKTEEAKPATAPKVEAKQPTPVPKPKAVPPPPPEEPSFVDELMDNPMLLAGGGGVLALLLAFVAIKRRRAAAPEEETPLAVAASELSQTSLSENSVFRNTGGQSVDTSHTPPQTDFSQAGPGTIDTDEVDPVAEADVYMAYGRDAQAEEILLEAKTKDPKRHAIHLKLLEIYANRQSLPQFEALATELYGNTGGVGGDWEKAAALGLKLDPQNPLYGGVAKAAAPGAGFDSEATLIVSADAIKNTVVMPGQLAQMAEAVEPAAATPAPTPASAAPAAAADEPVSLDFDLAPAAPVAPPEKAFDLESTMTQPGALQAAAEEGDALDFDLGRATPAAAPADAAMPTEAAGGLDFDLPEIKVEEASANEASALDFDLGFDTAATPAASAPSSATAAVPEPAAGLPAVGGEGLEFDVNLTESTVLNELPATPAFDMTTINLDLAESKPAVAGADAYESEQMATMVNPDLVASLTSQSEMAPMGANEEVATKLDLAKAYEEMGDLEGARELLQEVIQEGNAEQQAAAQAMLERVG